MEKPAQTGLPQILDDLAGPPGRRLDQRLSPTTIWPPPPSNRNRLALAFRKDLAAL